ncbi:MAG: hypothetical protein MUC59_01655 [Saprospiraceae bacterium]|nr:hypothetical protein [Saprospiraceae bacterium]
MLKKTVFGLSAALLLLAMMSGCAYDNFEELYPPDPAGCDTSAVSFANDIEPLMKSSCGSLSTGCHAVGNFNDADLDSYEGVKAVADNGKLVSSVTWDGVATNSRMPSGSSSKMDDCTIQDIQQWVADGAPDN